MRLSIPGEWCAEHPVERWVDTDKVHSSYPRIRILRPLIIGRESASREPPWAWSKRRRGLVSRRQGVIIRYRSHPYLISSRPRALCPYHGRRKAPVRHVDGNSLAAVAIFAVPLGNIGVLPQAVTVRVRRARTSSGGIP